MSDKENIFLAKIQLVCDTLDEIDRMMDENPAEQQKIDFEISDYLHLLQNEDLNDTSMLTIVKKLKNARLKRATLQNTALLIKSFNDNKERILRSNTRGIFRSSMRNTMNRLHQDYNYRVLEESEIKEIKSEKDTIKVTKPGVSESNKKRAKINEKDLIECIEKGMTTKEMAEYFNSTPSSICHAKKRFGIENRHYNRK